MFTRPQLRTFPCPDCNEIVDDSSTACRFCGKPIDSETAVAGAEAQAAVNQACSDASYAEIAGVAMWVFLALSWLSLLYVFFWGFLATFILVPILLIRWQVRSGRIKTRDPDYRKARRSWKIAVVLWLVAFLAEFAPILDAIIFFRSHGSTLK